MRKKIYISGILVFILFGSSLLVSKAQAATLSSASDIITTSRPSVAAPLAADQAASAMFVKIVDTADKLMFLASDSATLRPDTGETMNTVTVASASAADTPASNQRLVFFTGAAANTHHQGDAIVVPITALHKIAFTIPNAIPASGKVVITFPGSADATASPSATTFAFNGLTSTNIQTNNITCNSWSVSSPSITCTTNSSVAANTTITFLIGCSAATGASCDTQVPTLINPTKTAAAGTADTWKITLQTKDTNSVVIDDAKVMIGTVESVYVQAFVEPTFTFSIAGVADATAINNGNTTGCTNTESTNTGVAASATTVDLGTLSSGAINISAQLLTITTNGVNGYTLTATSSGHLINPQNGFWINDSTTPTVMTAGTPWFGVHPCGLDVTSGTWATGATGGGANAKYGWPTAATSVSLASDTTGPIGNSLTAGNGLVSVEYASTVNAGVPTGLYYATITYVATPTF